MAKSKKSIPQLKPITKTGYFKENFSYYSAKTLETMFGTFPNWKKTISKDVGISVKTFDKILNNESGKANFRTSTLKKLTQSINRNLDVEQQIKFAEIAKHLKHYKSISPKKLKQIEKKALRQEKRFKNVEQKNREWIIFRALYGNGKGK